MERITLKSGSKLNITLAPVYNSIKLLQEVIKAFKNNGISLKIDRETEIDFMKLFEDNSDMFLGGLAEVVSSEKVLECVLACSEKCLYEKNGVKHKINLGLFDDEEIRKDFIEVIFKISIENLKPFFPNRLT